MEWVTLFSVLVCAWVATGILQPVFAQKLQKIWDHARRRVPLALAIEPGMRCVNCFEEIAPGELVMVDFAKTHEEGLLMNLGAMKIPSCVATVRHAYSADCFGRLRIRRDAQAEVQHATTTRRRPAN